MCSRQRHSERDWTSRASSRCIAVRGIQHQRADERRYYSGSGKPLISFDILNCRAKRATDRRVPTTAPARPCASGSASHRAIPCTTSTRRQMFLTGLQMARSVPRTSSGRRLLLQGNGRLARRGSRVGMSSTTWIRTWSHLQTWLERMQDLSFFLAV